MRLRTDGAWPTKQLAAQVLINCDYDSYGCSGGSPLTAYGYMQSTGIPDESCLPLTGTQEQCNGLNRCRSCKEDGTCEAVTNYRKYYVSTYGRVTGETSMMREIYNRGTISCRIDVNRDFTYYRRGIFASSGPSLYTHYVTIVGWGEEDEDDYWIVRNSWGSYWGENGFARIRRGFNIMGIESDCSWAEPILNGLNVTSVAAEKLSSAEKLASPSELTSASKLASPSKLSTSTTRSSTLGFSSCGYPTDWTLNTPVIKTPIPSSYVNVSSLPSTYDIRNLDGRNYATPQRNEHSPLFCNACWAQATTSAISDRLNLQKKGAWPMVIVSSQVVLNCVGNGCGGGDTGDVYRYAYTDGLPDTTCQAYEGRQKSCSDMGICMDCDRNGNCWGVANFRSVFVSEYGEVTGVDAMKAEIHERGPITCFIVMTKEFMEYSGGVFVEHDHRYQGGHIVEVTGWGVTSLGQHYWIVRNNWGESWGESGWVRMNMGGSNLMIESACSWGVPYLV